jgi:steroid delta-isomerase-like uncharacterized protein
MAKGSVASIHIASSAIAPMRSLQEARAVPGKGLEGDRYFHATGTYSGQPGLGREVTFIELEAIEALQRESGISLAPEAARRNVVSHGIALNHLVGREFRVGEARLRGLRLCEPCTHLEGLSGPGLKAALHHRGGLRADIITGGTIHVGDIIIALDIAEEQNRDLIRRYYEEMWNHWDFELAEQVLAPEIAFHGSLGVTTRGIAAFRKYMQTVRDAFPDFHNRIEELVAENQQVVARLTYHGTHSGEILGIAPMGKKITYAGAAFFQIAGGRITEGWVLGDRMSLLQQLGETSVSGLAEAKVKK